MAQTCTHCGCTAFHYNSARRRVVCDGCGHPVADPQLEQQMMQYDRTYAQAMDHLAAGNWEQTIQMIRPLLSQRPTEKRLYMALLRAATRDFSDIAMTNTSYRTTASDAWSKLLRLQGVTGDMLRYSRRRYELHRTELQRQRNKLVAWIFAAAASSVAAGLAIGSSAVFLAVLCAGSLAGCLYKAFSLKPVEIVRQLTSTVPDHRSDPFV